MLQKRLTWDLVRATIRGTGHMFCGLAKDLWSCSGERYRTELERTSPYRAGMNMLPAGTYIYAVGLSWFAEMILNIACEEATQVWKFGHRTSNDWLAAFGNGTYLLLSSKTLPTPLLEVFKPSAIVIGSQHGFEFDDKQRSLSKSEQYDAARASVLASLGSCKINVSHIIEAPGRGYGNPNPNPNPLSPGCAAEFSGCSNKGGHQCLPGPLARDSEGLLHLLHQCVSAISPRNYSRGKLNARCAQPVP